MDACDLPRLVRVHAVPLRLTTRSWVSVRLSPAAARLKRARKRAYHRWQRRHVRACLRTLITRTTR